MSRSGYTDDCDDNPVCYLWGSIVRRATRGKRGQKALVDLIQSLDAMPVKELIGGSFQNSCGVCALGALAAHRGVDMSGLELSEDEAMDADPVDAAAVGKRLDIAPTLAREVMYENDNFPHSPSQRWTRMRWWAIQNLTPQSREALPGRGGGVVSKSKCQPYENIPITIRELRILKHTLGVDRYDRNGGRCPREFYRNGFSAGSEGHGVFAELKSLEAKSLMMRTRRTDQLGGLAFYVTELGIKLVREVVGSLMECECGAEIVPDREPGCWDCRRVAGEGVS